MVRTRLLIAGTLGLAAFLSCGGVSLAAGAAVVSVNLSPASIPADGTSTSTVTATVLDASGAPVSGESVWMFAADRGITFSPDPARDNHDGTYTSTLTSSRVAGRPAVLAQDGSLVSAPGFLTQTVPSTTSLAVVSDGPVSTTNLPVTNQGVTLVATVTASLNIVAPTGTVAFENGGNPIAGCAAVAIPTQSSPSVTVTCGTSFAAASSPARLSAVFTPSPSSFITGSSSPAQTFSINRDPTTTSVTMVGSKAEVGASLMFNALVLPSQQGSDSPSGSVQFVDNGKAIGSCGGQPLGTSAIATCVVSYKKPGPHDITARYTGDPSFDGSISGPATVAVQALGTINSTMQWSFFHTPTYTRILSLIVSGVPLGASVGLKCHGHGCPFARRTVTTGKARSCRSNRRHRCAPRSTIDLERWFRGKRLRIGAYITVEITKPGWVGRYYVITIRARRNPRVKIT